VIAFSSEISGIGKSFQVAVAEVCFSHEEEWSTPIFSEEACPSCVVDADTDSGQRRYKADIRNARISISEASSKSDKLFMPKLISHELTPFYANIIR
jgi:hypothetical protein